MTPYGSVTVKKISELSSRNAEIDCCPTLLGILPKDLSESS